MTHAKVTSLYFNMPSELSNFPAEFIERLRRILPLNQWQTLISTFAAPKPTTFRMNILKTTPEKMREQLEAQGFRLEPVAWYKDAFIVREGQLRKLQQTSSYQNGELYVQSLSSMVPPLVLDPQPNESVLDLAAAPGGKTTQIACLMRGLGRIFANDNNRIRFYKLRANVIQQGVPDIELSLRNGETFGKTHANIFNRVLVDAPCSTEGRFTLRDASSFKYWKLGKIHEMVRKQRRLLQAGAQALLPGGIIVYSTCTFAPEENEGVVDWLLGATNGSMELEPIVLPLSNTMPGLSSWEDKHFHPTINRTVRVLPTSEMEGFFIAKIRKLHVR